MILLTGLGNPGKQYEKNRHNIGFLFIDFIAEKFETKFKKDFDSEIAEVQYEGKKILLQKPLTFMNDSGKAVSKVKNFYKIPSENIYICFDDLDIVSGEFKLQFTKYPKAHNGVNDILHQLTTDKINFVRFGVENRPKENFYLKPNEFVLSDIDFDYKKVFENAYKELIGKITPT